MTKQSYLQHRALNQIHFGLAYEMYSNSEYNKSNLPPQVFMELLSMWLQYSGSNMELYFQHYDMKYEVVKLIGVDGNVSYF